MWGGGGQFKTREGRLISNLLEMAPLGGRDLSCGLLPGRSGRLVTFPHSFVFLDHVTHRLFFHFILFTYLILFILKIFKMVENCFTKQMHVAEGRTGQHQGPQCMSLHVGQKDSGLGDAVIRFPCVSNQGHERWGNGAGLEELASALGSDVGGGAASQVQQNLFTSDHILTPPLFPPPVCVFACVCVICISLISLEPCN